MGESNVKQAENAMDARLDAVFEETNAPNDVSPDTQRVIYKQMRQLYSNTIAQHKAEMRVALRLNVKEQQDAIRKATRECLEAIDEIDLMLSELPHANGIVPV